MSHLIVTNIRIMVLSRKYLEKYVCERFKNDERYRNGHIHIIAAKDGTEIIGLHTPEMKSIAKEIAKSDSWRETMSKFAVHKPLAGSGGLAHEERIIWGLAIDYAKCSLEERLRLVDDFLPCIDNWAICDTFCCNTAWAKRCDREVLWQYITGLMHSGKEWNIRVGVVLAMSHFLNEEEIGRTFEEIEKIGLIENEPYYVRMGVAWLLATALAKNEEMTREFVRRGLLPHDIIKLYVRKARESFKTRGVNAI